MQCATNWPCVWKETPPKKDNETEDATTGTTMTYHDRQWISVETRVKKTTKQDLPRVTNMLGWFVENWDVNWLSLAHALDVRTIFLYFCVMVCFNLWSSLYYFQHVGQAEKCASTQLRKRLLERFLDVTIWDIIGHLQGSKRPLPRKLRKKFEKGLPGPLGPRAKKQLEKESKVTIFRFFGGLQLVFDSLSTFFRAYCDPGAERPWQPLFRFFWSFSGKGLFGPCRWLTRSQVMDKALANLRWTFAFPHSECWKGVV